MRNLITSVSCAALCGVILAGCAKDEPSATAKPTTMMSSSTTQPTTMPAAAAMTDKDMTHEVTVETPIFTSMPMTAGAKPAMMLKAGEKVLVMVPRGKYAQVTTVGGTKGYVTTASLKPIGG